MQFMTRKAKVVIITINLWLSTRWSLAPKRLLNYLVPFGSVLSRVAQILWANSAPTFDIVNQLSLWLSLTIMFFS